VASPVKAAAEPIILDSSCWLEYFSDSPRADLFASALAKPQFLIVPLITVYEVYKKLLRELGAEPAHQAMGLMRQGHLIAADMPITLSAATNGLPMADSLIYATAQMHRAELWTQDAHFQGLTGVKYFPK
jgi:toxin FitB